MNNIFEDYLEAIGATAMVKKAKEFAEKKHAGQTRKDGTPYFIHPTRVANTVQKNKKSHVKKELVAAAYLHDTVEDCGVSIDEIKKEFGELVASLVNELTSDKDELIKQGKTKYLLEKMKRMSNWGLFLKLADRLDNIKDLRKASQQFRNKYFKETSEILTGLTKERKMTGSQKQIINKINKKLYLIKDKFKDTLNI